MRERQRHRRRVFVLGLELSFWGTKPYGVDFRGHASTTPCATAQGVLGDEADRLFESGGLDDREPRDSLVGRADHMLARRRYSPCEDQ
jgi:hypothetical protein